MVDTKAVVSRFFAKTEMRKNGCLEWTGTRVEKGYGRFLWKGKVVGAHRVAWEIANGYIPDGKWVLHSCDNPPCVLIDHLHIGTCAENQAEASSRKRWAKTSLNGETNVGTHLTDADVVEMRERYSAGGVSQERLAEKYSISQSQISNILLRRHWAHI